MSSSEPFDPRVFCLHFEGEPTRGHTVPAALLIEALQELQNVIFALVMSEKNIPFGQRLRTPHDIEKGFALVCGMTQEGGHRQPVRIESLGDSGLFTPQEQRQMGQKTHDVMSAFQNEDTNKIISLVSNPRYRERILKNLAAMSPHPGTGVVLSLEDNLKRKIADMGAVSEKAKQILSVKSEKPEEIQKAYVTGKLIVMQFHKRILRLELSGSKRTLDAEYTEDYEPELVQSRRDLIQVHGNVTYGDDSIPNSIYDVDEILPVDIDPIDVSLVKKCQINLRAKIPLSFDVKFDEEESFYSLDGPFGIMLGAHTRSELEDMLYDCLAMLWREYALEDPVRFKTSAQHLGKQLRESFEEIGDGV